MSLISLTRASYKIAIVRLFFNDLNLEMINNYIISNPKNKINN